MIAFLWSLYESRVWLLQQYWNSNKGAYKYIPVTEFADAFKQTAQATQSMQYLEEPYVAPNAKCDEALITHKYALSGELFLAAWVFPLQLEFTPIHSKSEQLHQTLCLSSEQ